MRKIIFLSFSFYLFISYSAMAQVVTNGLVGYWPFNGNATDLSPYSNDGVVVGATLTTDPALNPNSAYEFDALDYIDLEFQISEGSTWTASFWAYPTGLVESQNWILDKNGAANGIYLKSFDTDDVGFRGTNGARFDWDGTGNTQQVSFSGIRDQWNFFLFYSDGTNIHLYVGGTYKGYVTPASTSITVNTFGSDRGSNITFHGKIDDVYIFDRVLNAQEIALLSSQTSVEQAPIAACSNFYCDDDNVGIGIASTDGYKLAVGGKIIGEEMTVSLVENWPDYVFEEGYPLRTLEETEAFIIRNKHLPEVPKESQVVENGLNVGKMNAKLLQKIEELTLYLIEQNQKTKSLSKQVTILDEKVSELQQENQRLKGLPEN